MDTLEDTAAAAGALRSHRAVLGVESGERQHQRVDARTQCSDAGTLIYNSYTKRAVAQPEQYRWCALAAATQATMVTWMHH